MALYIYICEDIGAIKGSFVWQRSSSFLWKGIDVQWMILCVCNKISWAEESLKGSVTHTITIKQSVTWKSICDHNYGILCKAAHIIRGAVACPVA